MTSDDKGDTVRTSSRLLVLGLSAAVTLGVAALPASAGDLFVFKIAKQKSGPYSGDSITRVIDPGQSKAFYLKASTLPGDEPQSATLSQPGKAIYKTKYFKGDHNITQEVQGGGYEFTLKDKPKKFRGVVKDIGNAPDPSCIPIELETTSPGGVDLGVNAICS